MAKGLTDRQREVFEFIRDEMRCENRPPTVREISAHFEFKSPKAASDHLSALERKGYISRRNSKARNIQIPQELSPLGIPVIAQVPGDSPLLDVENIESSLNWSSLFGEQGDTFAVRVPDNSMEESDIRKGDYVIISASEEVENGDVAAVFLDHRPVLRRVYREGEAFRVVADSSAHEDREINADAEGPRVLGPAKGLVRRI